jgi:hypothetical protein
VAEERRRADSFFKSHGLDRRRALATGTEYLKDARYIRARTR